MSYRGFKRLLGETSLERKTRWLLGSGIMILMSVSFYVYARQTEDLAYDQLAQTGRALVSPVVTRAHVRPGLGPGMDEFQEQTERTWPDKLRAGYKYKLIRTADERGRFTSTREERKPAPEDLGPSFALMSDPTLPEVTKSRPQDRDYLFYGAVRAGPACIGCHTNPAEIARLLEKPESDPLVREFVYPDLKPGELMAVVRVQLPTASIEAGFHQNRALLMAFASGTTFLILVGSYVIIRYVVVKPVKHLKNVSDAIAAGHLNVRSEIQTGDEFEDLSHAFNRMLRNLVSMQDRNRSLIADLDRKVDELARLNMALYESNRLKGEFLSTMSHELRTPLNSVIGFSEVLLAADNLTEKQHRWAGNILTSGQQLLAMINDILDLAKMEAGKMRVHPEPVNVPELCESAAGMARQSAERKSVELRVAVPPDLPIVRQDAGKLRQILSNLLSNAVKFTPEGGRVTLSAAVQDDVLTLTVADTGVGIAPEEQELVFDKFRQASNPLTREQGGSGLGLSIVRELAKLLGGDISLQSDLGRGSTFTVRVSARLAEDPGLMFDLPEVRREESVHRADAPGHAEGTDGRAAELGDCPPGGFAPPRGR